MKGIPSLLIVAALILAPHFSFAAGKFPRAVRLKDQIAREFDAKRARKTDKVPTTPLTSGRDALEATEAEKQAFEEVEKEAIAAAEAEGGEAAIWMRKLPREFYARSDFRTRWLSKVARHNRALALKMWRAYLDARISIYEPPRTKITAERRRALRAEKKRNVEAKQKVERLIEQLIVVWIHAPEMKDRLADNTDKNSAWDIAAKEVEGYEMRLIQASRLLGTLDKTVEQISRYGDA